MQYPVILSFVYPLSLFRCWFLPVTCLFLDLLGFELLIAILFLAEERGSATTLGMENIVHRMCHHSSAHCASAKFDLWGLRT